MGKISDIFSSDHRHCDDLFSSSENHVHKHNWQEAQRTFADFAKAMEQHFTKEEDILFPELINRTAGAIGPVQVMRAEHADMRQLLKELQEDIGKQDADHFLGTSETLLIMMQQHNNKEENILYQMADEVLGNDTETILPSSETT